MNRYLAEQFNFRFGGGAAFTPPKPPAPPSQDTAAKNLLQQGMKKPPVGFDDTILGNNKQGTSALKNLLGD